MVEALSDWSLKARPTQLPPVGEWFVWLVRAGRGFGKTRTGAEYVRSRIDAGTARTVNVAGPTASSVMHYMIRGTPGAPGLMGVWPQHQRPKLNKQERILTCHNGAIIYYASAFEADVDFRGPQADLGWADEVDTWKPKGMKVHEAFDLFELGIRLGEDPRICVTSTPKPGRIVSKLMRRTDCALTSGSTYDNAANLAPRFLEMVTGKYAGTHLGKQEIEGELREEILGALVSAEMIEDGRVEQAPDLVRLAVGVDPSGSSDVESGNQQGIVAVGRGVDGHGYAVEDRSCTLSPSGWGRRAIELYLDVGADCIVAERNFGGDMVQYVIQQAAKGMEVPCPPVRMVTASRGKHVRFEPLALLYEQGRFHHVGEQPELELQVRGFTETGWEQPQGCDSDSPDRGDAEVWAATEVLMLSQGVSWDDLYPETAEEATA